MRIAQVSPLCESVPPICYGGTERVVSYLTESLVELGHDVTLFASGDSKTAAKLVAASARSLRLDHNVVDPTAHHLLLAEKVMARANQFDIIHWHIDYLHFPLARRHGPAHVTTLHGRLDLPHLPAIFDEFSDIPVVSISDAQRAPLPQARWVGTIYHGLSPELYRAGPGDGGYFVFLGRISPEKRVDRAVKIATRLGVPLIVAAKVDRADAEYYRSEVAVQFEHPLVEFIGEVGERKKQELLCGARAVLFPIDWPEPFGLVMIEAMACGTPVIAYRCGSVPEVMVDGVTGFVVDDDEQAVEAAARIGELDRGAVRRVFEQRYSAHHMAESYLAIYSELIRSDRSRRSEAAA